MSKVDSAIGGNTGITSNIPSGRKLCNAFQHVRLTSCFFPRTAAFISKGLAVKMRKNSLLQRAFRIDMHRSSGGASTKARNKDILDSEALPDIPKVSA